MKGAVVVPLPLPRAQTDIERYSRDWWERGHCIQSGWETTAGGRRRKLEYGAPCHCECCYAAGDPCCDY